MFPFDATESTDFDADGTGDNADTDDDNDGCLDGDDDNPLSASGDSDGDGSADDCDSEPNCATNDTDACSVCAGDGSTCSEVELSFGAADNGSVDILYSGASRDISGFQFSISNLYISSVSSDAANWILSENDGKIIGYNFGGQNLASGSGVLVQLIILQQLRVHLFHLV